MLTKKPHLLKISNPLDASFVIKGDEIAWDNPWHYHPELELIYCIKGKGTNFVGDAIKSIEEGEVLLFGSNLPHTRQRDKAFYEKNINETPESIVVQFKSDFLGENFFDILEFQTIKQLINKSLRGLKFSGQTLKQVTQKLKMMVEQDNTRRMISLLEILDILSKSTEYEYFNTRGYKSDVHEKNAQKINKVYEFTITNFRETIGLAEVAALTNLSISAFCRYFKIRTRKSYFQYLTEVRIGYACKLLNEDEHDIAQIAYESGFNNLSNFNKQFKKVMQLTPGQYKSMYLKR
ncbi:MAG: AraC family transcriptional regulator [Leadbetterella sp.]